MSEREDLIDRGDAIRVVGVKEFTFVRITREYDITPFIHIGTMSHYTTSDMKRLIDFHYDPEQFTWEEIRQLYIGGVSSIKKLINKSVPSRKTFWGRTFDVKSRLIEHLMALGKWRKREDYDAIRLAIIECKTAHRDRRNAILASGEWRDIG